MREYMPGQGSYKVEEAGGLTGSSTTNNVDNNFGTLTMSNADFSISARGLDLALSSTFNSDHFYSTIIPRVSKGQQPADEELITLPADQTNFYRLADGWSWELPYVNIGQNGIFKFAPANGKIFDMVSILTQECWGQGVGKESWTEGYHVKFATEVDSVSPVTIVIPEIQTTIVCDVERIEHVGDPQPPDDFKVLNNANFKIYNSSGAVLKFNANGYLASITDPSGVNTLTYSYVVDAINGEVEPDPFNRKIFTIDIDDYNGLEEGDLLTVRDETRVVFEKNGSGIITVSGKYDVDISEGNPYIIHKGKLQKIEHTDGRCVKFYYYDDYLVTMLSSDPEMDHIAEGDVFLNRYTIVLNKLTKFEYLETDSSFTPSQLFDIEDYTSYFSPIRETKYEYRLTKDPSPETDTIKITNNAGAETIYYFQKGGFCSHIWNNAFFFHGTARRGGTETALIIERPDFYISPGAYININRIDDQAFEDVSKDNYQKDENAAEFKTDMTFYATQFALQQAIAIAQLGQTASSLNPGSISFGLAAGALSFQLSNMQFAHTIGKHAMNAKIAANASQVSSWVPVESVLSASKITTDEPLADRPRQNDIFAILDKTPAHQKELSRTSRNSTRMYFADDVGPNGLGYDFDDYIFIRTECRKITETGDQTFGTTKHYYIEVDHTLPFLPSEKEEVAFLPSDGMDPLMYYCYYLNKPKVARVEIKERGAGSSGKYWTMVDYEYTYMAQDSEKIDDFYDGGFTTANIEGPHETSFEPQNIVLLGTVITTYRYKPGNEDYYTKEFHKFSYSNQSSALRGEEAHLSYRCEGTDWYFVKSKVNMLGRPCRNSSYFGEMGHFIYEGGDVRSGNATGTWRYREDYRFDYYGRPIRTRKTSPSFEGRKTMMSYTQYVGSKDYNDNDPLRKFAGNPYSGNYQAILDSKHALGLVGATIEEINAAGDTVQMYNEYDSNTLNLTKTLAIENKIMNRSNGVAPENDSELMFEYDYDNTLRGTHDETEVYTFDEMRWSTDEEEESSDWNIVTFEADGAVRSVHLRELISSFEYDVETNNLVKIIKPLGNEINIVYGDPDDLDSPWKSSYVVKDYIELEENLGNPVETQCIVNAYDYDLKGRMTEKTTRFMDDLMSSDFDNSKYPANKVEYEYDGMNRVVLKKVGTLASTTPVSKVEFFETGDLEYENPYVVTTDYLGFRSKTYYDSLYKLVRTESYKPNQKTSGDLDYSSGWEVLVSSEETTFDPVHGQPLQVVKYTDPAEGVNDKIVTRNTYDSIGRIMKVEYRNFDDRYDGMDKSFRTISETEYDEKTNSVITKTYFGDKEYSFDYILTKVENDWLGRGPIREYSWTGKNGTGTCLVVNNHYDHVGNLIKKVLPNGETYLYDYNNMKKLKRVSYPDGTASSAQYDKNGNAITSIDRRNISSSMKYNSADMLIETLTPDSVNFGDKVMHFKYCQYGPTELLYIENSNEVLSEEFEYHWSSQNAKYTQTVDSRSLVAASSFNVGGVKTSYTVYSSQNPTPWSKTVDLDPLYYTGASNEENLMRSAVLVSSNTIIVKEQNYLGLLDSVKFGNFASPVRAIEYTYDNFLAVKEIKSNESSPSNPSMHMVFKRDFIGNVRNRTEQYWTTPIDLDYSYDGMNRLESGEDEEFMYDDLSNITERGNKSYEYQEALISGNNQMRLEKFKEGESEFEYSYDENGNTVSISGRFSNIKYDNTNRLREIVHSGQTDKYWYNSDGLRVKKVEDDTAQNGTRTVTYTMYSGEDILLQDIYQGAQGSESIVETRFNILG